MGVEYIRGWLREANKVAAAEAAVGDMEVGMVTEANKETKETEAMEKATTEMSHWKKVLALVQAIFLEERLAEDAT